MNILLIHNYYGSSAPSGENSVFLEEMSFLKSRGHSVYTYTKNSDKLLKHGFIGSILGGLMYIINPIVIFEIRRVIKKHSIEIVHIHNIFPTIGFSIFYGLPRKIPIVLTLHNYRIQCGNGVPLRNGKTCTECIIKKSPLPLIKYGCYRNSRISSLPHAITIQLSRILKTYKNRVATIICLTEFQKNLLICGGLDPKNIKIKPNFLSDNAFDPRYVKIHDRADSCVYVGRLSEEKGINILLEAWKILDENSPALTIIGSGALERYLLNFIKENPKLKIDFLGSLSKNQVLKKVAESKLLILPSICLEGFSMSAVEAIKVGTPICISNIGSLPQLIANNNGFSFTSNSATSLAKSLIANFNNTELMSKMSSNALTAYHQHFSSQAHEAQIIKIYQDAIINHN